MLARCILRFSGADGFFTLHIERLAASLSLHPFRATVTLLVLALSLIMESRRAGNGLLKQAGGFRRKVFSRNVFARSFYCS